MYMDLPDSILSGRSTAFHVKLAKDGITSYSKLEIKVPEGIELTGKENSTGNFSFSDHHAKIIWPVTPSAADLVVEIEMTAANAGTFAITLNYYYLDGTNKQEVESEPFIFTSQDSQPANVEPSYSRLKTFVPSSPEVPVSDPAAMQSEDPGDLRMHAYQLRKDSKDAFKTGETEKRKASENLEDAATILRQAEYLDDPDLKALIIKQATPAKTRAEMDVEIANKILKLAKSLEDDANALEKKLAGKGVTKPLAGSQATADNSNTKGGGIVYRIQLGAFGNHPSRSEFQALGKVDILNENGLYKVMLGQYGSKQDAFQKRDQLISKGFDAFVVGYQDGVRLK